MSPKVSPDQSTKKIRIGMIWGDYPWESPPPKIGKLFSAGAVARNTTWALNSIGQVIPFDDSKYSPTEFVKSVDVIFGDFYPGTEPFLKARAQENITCPFLLFAAGAMPKGAEALLFPWQNLLQSHDQLIFTCEGDRAIWDLLTDQSQLNTWVVPLSVDQEIFKPHNDSKRIRDKLNIALKSPMLLYVGRLNIQKNIHSLLYAFADIHAQIPESVLCLVGEEDDIVLGEFGVKNTGYVQWLRELAQTLGIDHAIRFPGPFIGEDLAKIYASSDLFLNFSFYHRENFGLAQAEAQSCALPVICSGWGGFKEVVKHGETGFLVDAALTQNGIRVDWKSASQYAHDLLSNTKMRDQFAQSAYQMAQTQFSCTKYAERLKTIINSALTINNASGQSTYQPSAFAHALEAHKKECGWYGPPSRDFQSKDIVWRQRSPKMYQGEKYNLYKTLIAPYATYDASAHNSLKENLIPYLSPWLKKHSTRQMLQDDDPVWPARHYLTAGEWLVLNAIDGRKSIVQLASEIPDSKHVLSGLHQESLVLFSNPLQLS